MSTPTTHPSVSPKSKATAFGVGAVLVVLVSGLLSWGQSLRDARDLQEARALMVGRSIVEVARRAGLEDGSSLQALLDGLRQAAPDLKEALLLKGTSYLAHTDPAKAGKRLSRDSVEDKALYDLTNKFKTTHDENAKIYAENPDLGRRLKEELRVDGTSDPVVATLPVFIEDQVKALARVTLQPASVSSSAPWLWLIVLAIAATGLVFLAGTTFPSALTAVALLCGVLLPTGSALLLRSHQRADYLQHAASRAALATSLQAAYAKSPAAGSLTPEALAFIAIDRQENTYADLALQGEGVGVREEAMSPVFDRHTKSLLLAGALLAAGLLAIFALVASGLWSRFVTILRENSFAYAYTMPAMVGMLILVFIPFAYGVVLSFTRNTYNVWSFVGFDNFFRILGTFEFKARNFYYTFGVTVLWTVLNVTLHVVIGLSLALLLQDKMLRLKAVYRVLLVIPWAVPNYITALIWQGMFHKEFGAVNHYLSEVGVEPISWFTSFSTAFIANLTTNTWLGFPFMMVISLGALQSIPGDLYEAAEVDGASKWQQFRAITLPLLKPALFPAIILGTIWTFNQFNIIYLVSGGQPANSTDILVVEAYRLAFENNNYGGAAAYSTVIFFILLAYTVVSNRWTRATAGAFE